MAACSMLCTDGLLLHLVPRVVGKRQLLVCSGASYGNGNLGDSIWERHHKSSAQGARRANTPPTATHKPWAHVQCASTTANEGLERPHPLPLLANLFPQHAPLSLRVGGNECLLGQHIPVPKTECPSSPPQLHLYGAEMCAVRCKPGAYTNCGLTKFCTKVRACGP